MLQFRPLNEMQEVRVFLMQPAACSHNVAQPDQLERLMLQGRALAVAGIRVWRAVSSPQEQCIRSLEAVLDGMHSEDPSSPTAITQERDLNDIWTERGMNTNKLRFRAQTLKIAPGMVLMTDSEYADIMDGRGQESALLVHMLVSMMRNEIPLNERARSLFVASHSCSRLEAMLLRLLGQNKKEQRLAVAQNRHKKIQLFEDGQIAEIVFADLVGTIHIRYLTDADFQTS